MLEIVPSVELPPVTPPTAHVTPVFVELVTVAENWKVSPTVKAAGDVPKATVTAVAVVVVVVAVPAEWQPTINASRLKLIPRTHVLRRKSRFIAPAPIKSEFRFDWFDILRT